MINNTFRSILFFVLVLSSISIKAQDAPPSDGVFRIKNVATGKFLTASSVSAAAVAMSDSGELPNTHFKFVQTGSFYNIDSEVSGILRGPGSSGPGGAFVVVSTTKKSPASDGDKIWKIKHNDTNDTYRFQSANSSRFMYHNENGTVTHIVVSESDNRSNWELVPFVETPVEIAPDEDTSTDLSCSDEFRNATRTSSELPNRVNVGTIDDRSCYSDYSESNFNGKTWGVYNITDGSNHIGTSLQPRIERSLPRSGETGVGSYAKFSATLRILEVADGGAFSNSGSYLAQAKGKHSGGGGSPDPAICLYRAHPVYGTGINADKQIAFDIYAERILERGGEGNGREVVLLKRVNKNEEISFVLEVGFRADPNDATKKIHYCDAIIGGEAFNYNIPSPERGLESGIRYGAYRVRGGRAQFRWADTTYERVEVEDRNIVEPSDDIFRLKNVATGKFLTDSGKSATAVTMTDSGEPRNTHWTFVKSGDFFNIDSETFGIMRAKGTGEVVSTSKGSPAADSDKVWTIRGTGTENVFRIEARSNGKFLYHEEDGSVTNIVANENDTRSHWQAIPTSQSLSVEDQLALSSVKVYPNPAEDKFVIALEGFTNVQITISDLLGKIIYQTKTTKEKIELSKSNGFESGLYLIQIATKNGLISNKKLLIK